MKKTNLLYLLLLAVLLPACSFFETEDVVDPNALPVDAVLQNPTPSQLNQLGIGLQSMLRGTTATNGLVDFYRNTGTVGREIIYSASTDNRYYLELLGTQAAGFNGANDPNGILNAYYTVFSQARRQAELLARSADNTPAALLTAEEKAGIRGFARTLQAYVMLNLLNMQGANGIREGFTDLLAPGDLLKPGRFTTYEEGLALVAKTLDEAAADLAGAGDAFAITLTSGFGTGLAGLNFRTPANFRQFNRGLAARVAMYRQDWPAMRAALDASFLDLDGALTVGPVLTYSTAAGDLTNALFQRANTGGAPWVVFDEHVAEAEAGDRRVFGATAKVRKRDEPRQSGVVTSAYEVAMYAGNTAPVSLLRNEELILMYAEANLQTANFAEAVQALDRIRTAFGLAPLATARPGITTDREALIDELLNQRRYSLFLEGHRWFDARRYNKIAALPLQGEVDGNTYKVFERFNRPDAEVQWDHVNGQ